MRKAMTTRKRCKSPKLPKIFIDALVGRGNKNVRIELTNGFLFVSTGENSADGDIYPEKVITIPKSKIKAFYIDDTRYI